METAACRLRLAGLVAQPSSGRWRAGFNRSIIRLAPEQSLMGAK
jgi:hypothetical protein